MSSQPRRHATRWRVPRDVMDFLTAAFEELTIEPAAVAAHGLARVAVRSSAVHRLEFETYVVGRYAQFLHRLSRRNAETRARVGVEATTAPKHHALDARPHPVGRAPRSASRAGE